MKTLLLLLLLIPGHMLLAQQKTVSEKALLYQVTGNGLKKPSYVYGTMHVSNKLAFYLSDTFFYALKSADVVGLETDPGKWFDQMLVSEHYSPLGLFDGAENKINNISKDVFDFKVANRVLSRAMSGTPRIVNGFLYRHAENTSDFEEDTYLDLYIYQAACKLGKEVHSVEDFEESERLVKLAKEAVINNKTKTYVRHKSALVGENNLETAYRNGDIDMIDSLDNLMRYPAEYYENMLYKRNANMARYMDSLMSVKSMFVGVGVSHLPGKKGLLNMLQEMGYTVKAVSKINKNSPQKEAIDNINAPASLQSYTSDDGLFTMKVPGKMYTYPKDNYSQKYLCQDMANGAYCLVTRVRTYASLFNQDAKYNLMRADSLLYENIPGKILSKNKTAVNGYEGYDIANKTAQGKFQRHLVLAMPDEILFFRLHGSENYIKKYGQKFIESITLSVPLKEYSVNPGNGFTVQFPATPAAFTERSGLDGISPARKEWILSGNSGVFYATQLIVNNTGYIEEDSFELELMAHTFSDQLKGEIFYKKHTGSTLSFSMADNQKDTAEAMVLIRANKAYLLYTKTKDAGMKGRFFASFKISPVNYGTPFSYTDTTFHYKVTTYVKPYDQSKFERYGEEKKDSVKAYSGNHYFMDKNTGDEVRLHYYRYNKYEQEVDSLKYWKWRFETLNNSGDNGVTVLGRWGSGNNHTLEFVTHDTLSTRGVRYKVFLHGDVAYRLSTATDAKGNVSDFAKVIFETFEPVNASRRPSLFDDRVPLFKSDIVSRDSATKAQAEDNIDEVYFNADSTARLIAIIESLQPGDKYEDMKAGLIKRLALSAQPAVLPWLEKVYNNSEDTLAFKLAVLYSLSRIRSKASYNLWIRLVNENMPEATQDQEVSEMIYGFGVKDTNEYIKLVMPTILKFLYIQDYKAETYSLLARLKDKKLIKPSAYKKYIDVMLVDARRELKEQKENEKQSWYTSRFSLKLNAIDKLIVPFYAEPAVKKHIDKVLLTKSDELKINTLALIAQYNFALNDTMVYNLAAKPLTRQKLYEKLKLVGRENQFPADFASPDKRLEGLIRATVVAANQACDTVIIFGHSTINYYNKDYTIHAFKFKKMDDMVWQTGITAVCDHDSCYYKLNKELSGISAKYYNETLAAEKFINDEVRNLRAAKRSGRYTNSYYNYEDEFSFDFED